MDFQPFNSRDLISPRAADHNFELVRNKRTGNLVLSRFGVFYHQVQSARELDQIEKCVEMFIHGYNAGRAEDARLQEIAKQQTARARGKRRVSTR